MCQLADFRWTGDHAAVYSATPLIFRIAAAKFSANNGDDGDDDCDKIILYNVPWGTPLMMSAYNE